MDFLEQRPTTRGPPWPSCRPTVSFCRASARDRSDGSSPSSPTPHAPCVSDRRLCSQHLRTCCTHPGSFGQGVDPALHSSRRTPSLATASSKSLLAVNRVREIDDRQAVVGFLANVWTVVVVVHRNDVVGRVETASLGGFGSQHLKRQFAEARWPPRSPLLQQRLDAKSHNAPRAVLTEVNPVALAGHTVAARLKDRLERSDVATVEAS
mmetsp:Transcript_85561/g.178759  ORF Transcript_85561/g.178759 Transcript_85561/m.178759 type:complete len:209 (+) Transcript_85561:588-1214(+)